METGIITLAIVAALAVMYALGKWTENKALNQSNMRLQERIKELNDIIERGEETKQRLQQEKERLEGRIDDYKSRALNDWERQTVTEIIAQVLAKSIGKKADDDNEIERKTGW